MSNTKVAVILSGCGHFDGAEIRESVLALLALDSHEVSYEIFAPNENQYHTINHLNGEEIDKPRNILEESARIARGNVTDLKELKAENFSALLIPGGFGVAKNFSNFAFNGSQGEALPQLSKVINEFFTMKKPIGAICIAPALIALILGKNGIEVTIGNDQGTAEEIEKTGAKHFPCAKDEFHLDQNNKIATTPAYMYDDNKLHFVQKGINAVVENIINWA